SDREGPYSCLRGDLLLPRNLSDRSVRVEQQPVIHAAQPLAFTPTKREGGKAMDASVLQRDQPAACSRAIDHDRFSQDRDRERLVVRKLVAPGGDIPGVSYVHAVLRVSSGGPRRDTLGGADIAVAAFI